MSDNPLFDGEGIEAEHLLLGGALLGQAATNKKLNDIKKELQKKPKQGPPCPHCGGKLPGDAQSKQYSTCCHCGSSIYWFDRKVYADKNKRDRLARADRERTKSMWARTQEQAAQSGPDGILSQIINWCSSQSYAPTKGFFKKPVEITADMFPMETFNSDKILPNAWEDDFKDMIKINFGIDMWRGDYIWGGKSEKRENCITLRELSHLIHEKILKNMELAALTTADIHAHRKQTWKVSTEEKNKSTRKLTAHRTVSSVLSKILDEIKSNESIKAGVDITSETLPEAIWDKDWFYHMNWMIQRVFGVKLTKEQTNIKLGVLSELIFREAGGSCDTESVSQPVTKKSVTAKSPKSNNERAKKESTITFMCSNNHRVTVPVKFAGKSGRCSKCNVRIVVPTLQ